MRAQHGIQSKGFLDGKIDKPPHSTQKISPWVLFIFVFIFDGKVLREKKDQATWSSVWIFILQSESENVQKMNALGYIKIPAEAKEKHGWWHQPRCTKSTRLSEVHNSKERKEALGCIPRWGHLAPLWGCQSFQGLVHPSRGKLSCFKDVSSSLHKGTTRPKFNEKSKPQKDHSWSRAATWYSQFYNPVASPQWCLAQE